MERIFILPAKGNHPVILLWVKCANVGQLVFPETGDHG